MVIRSNLQIKYPGTNGLPDSTAVLLTVDGIETNTVFVYQYDDFDNPETIRKYDGGNTSGTADQVSRFYYETYDDELNIDGIDGRSKLTVYPNPFDKQINLECLGLPDQYCSFNLRDAVGNNIFTTHGWLSGGRATINIPSLHPGFYVLSIQISDHRTLNKRIVKIQ